MCRQLMRTFVVLVVSPCLLYAGESGNGKKQRRRKRADEFYTSSADPIDAPIINAEGKDDAVGVETTLHAKTNSKRKRKPNLNIVDADVDVDGSTTSSSNILETANQADEYLPFASLPPLRVDVSDPLKDYNKEGIAAATSGDLRMARQHFMAASHMGPYRADIWANLALSSISFVSPRFEGDGAGRARAQGSMEHAILCESRAAMDISNLLNGAPRSDIEGDIKNFLDTFGGEESCDISPIAKKRRMLAARAVKLVEHDAVGAANLLCKAPQAVRLKLTSEQKQRGALTASFVRAYLSRMRVCGVVAVENMYDPEFIDELEDAHQKSYDPTSLRGEIETESVGSRGIGRYEVKWPLEEPFTDPRLTLNAALVELVKGALVENHIELDTFSHVDSMPSAAMQHWHNDVDHIHRHTQTGESKHSPPQGVVVVVPVVDVNSENGPTEFLMGSHTNVPAFSDKDREQPTRSFPIPANKGDAVIFDIRIRHRGTPNNSPKVRPIIYMSYVAAWYRDEVNFKLPQSFKWDEQFKTVAARKLFMRVDQQRYISLLEAKLTELGIDVSDMQTATQYRAVKMAI